MNSNFNILVMMLASQAMMTMGKIKNPMTDKVEKDLMASQAMIDMLVALQEKTKGNLTNEEQGYLDNTVKDLRLNFIVERNKELAPTNPENSGIASEQGIPDNLA